MSTSLILTHMMCPHHLFSLTHMICPHPVHNEGSHAARQKLPDSQVYRSVYCRGLFARYAHHVVDIEGQEDCRAADLQSMRVKEATIAI